MTEREICAEFLILNSLIGQVAGADLPNAEREAVRTLAGSAMRLLEGVLLDHNRIANALEFLATEYNNRGRP